MMGSGKSTVGSLAAAELGVVFVDLDHRIERQTGRSCAEIIQTDGEARFRAIESASLFSLVAEPAFERRLVVVATGGGVVIESANRDLMARTGTILYLAVPVPELARRLAQTDAKGRPLLAPDMESSLSTLLERRIQAYRDRAIEIDADAAVEEVARRLVGLGERERDAASVSKGASNRE
jgi:shikimate kinase